MPLAFLLISFASSAKDETENGGAYNTGKFIGQYVLLPAVVLVIIIWIVRRNKKQKQ